MGRARPTPNARTGLIACDLLTRAYAKGIPRKSSTPLRFSQNDELRREPDHTLTPPAIPDYSPLSSVRLYQGICATNSLSAGLS